MFLVVFLNRYKDQLEEEIPEVDAYFGTKELPNILRTLNANYKHELVGERLLTTPEHYAYLKLQKVVIALVLFVPFHS